MIDDYKAFLEFRRLDILGAPRDRRRAPDATTEPITSSGLSCRYSSLYRRRPRNKPTVNSQSVFMARIMAAWHVATYASGSPDGVTGTRRKKLHWVKSGAGRNRLSTARRRRFMILQYETSSSRHLMLSAWILNRFIASSVSAASKVAVSPYAAANQ
ncbi:MAG: hypothetical protein A2Y36_17755 [Treponema sp. GWA1_62_8]|nr:MAG: hypothetical protein A2Y36_17755 [Treponema sp. GWA1_62_8]